MEGPGKIKQVSVKKKKTIQQLHASLFFTNVFFTVTLEMTFQEYTWSEREAQLQDPQEYIGWGSQHQPSVKKVKISWSASLKAWQSLSTIVTN